MTNWFSLKNGFLYRYLAMTLTPEMKHELHQVFHFLCETASSQPHVFMHRDYHSANLMVLPENQIGILDFQDAFIGPIAYDLVSLLRDCYIDWPDFLVTKLALAYLNKLDNPAIDQQQFLRWFDLMGLQRHLKALLTFSRKFIRDFNNQYLRYIPRTLNYIQVMSSRYPECQFLHRLCQQQILPLHQGKAFVCAP